MMNSKKLGDFFRGHRLAAGLELEQAAELLEIDSPEILSEYEDGSKIAPLSSIFAMTNLYNISPDAVMALFYGLSLGDEVKAIKNLG